MDFSDISSYSDSQVELKIKELKTNKYFLAFLSGLFYPKLNKYFHLGVNQYVKRKFDQHFHDCNSIEEFQNCLAPLVKKMVENTTDGFSYSGLENLSDKPTLFIGNHRDISLDAAFLNYLLYLQKMKTVRIAIGDNLLDGSFAEVLMRLNKSFIVHREIQGAKETLRKLSKLSAYINYSLTEDNESVWIAQKQGRANDGNDFTDEAVLKMLYLDKRKTAPLDQWVKDTNLTPIVISYEYDPLDIIKAQGWVHQEHLNLVSRNKNDLNEMTSGIFGYKGKVHLHICKPVSFSGDNIKHLAEIIDKEIISNYRIWPSSQISLLSVNKSNPDISYQDNNVGKSKEHIYVQERFKDLDPEVKNRVLMTYAQPLINKEKARLAPGP